MPQNEISDYNETDASNVDITGIDVQENAMRPPAVNNAFRALQGALKRWFKASLFRLRDGTDQTKLLAFDLSGITTATTRTLTVPDQSGTLALLERGNVFRATQTINPTSGPGELAIGSGAANTVGRQISFFNQSSTISGYVQFVPNTVGTNSVMNFYVGGATAGDLKFSINDDGLVTLPAGQIKFPATDNPSSDANTLDDYEEQNTTPAPSATGGTFTSASSAIRTTKIGRLVTVSGTVTITTAGTATGSVFVALPFTAGAAAGGGGRETAVTGKGLTVSIGSGSSVLTIGYADATASIANGLVLAFSISYTV